MNKDLLDQLSADEQSAAEKLSSAAETMKLSLSFQWNLETQLMNAHQSKTEGIGRNWLMRFLTPVGWAIVAIFGVLVLSWMLRFLLPGIQVAAGPTPTQKDSFETDVRTNYVPLPGRRMGNNWQSLAILPDEAISILRTQLAVRFSLFFQIQN